MKPFADLALAFVLGGCAVVHDPYYDRVVVHPTSTIYVAPYYGIYTGRYYGHYQHYHRGHR